MKILIKYSLNNSLGNFSNFSVKVNPEMMVKSLKDVINERIKYVQSQQRLTIKIVDTLVNYTNTLKILISNYRLQ